MSGESFGVALLPISLPLAAVEAIRASRERAERQRIEAELRLKIETEQRRKEAEQQLLVETEKTKAVFERLRRAKEKEEEEKRKAQIAHQEEERRRKWEKKLLENGIILDKERPMKNLSQEIAKSSEKEKEVLSKLQAIELKISQIEPFLAELIKTDLKDIENSLNEIKGKISGSNYSYFENILKWLDIRLREAVEKGKNKQEAMAKEFDALSQKAVELLTDIEMVINSPFLPDKIRVLELKTALETTVSDKNIVRLKTAIETITPEIKMLYNQYLEIEKLNDERRYIIESVQSVLTEMGYEVSKLPYRTVENPQAPLFMEANIPGGEGVRLGFGVDKSIFAEVFHPEAEGSIDKEKFKAQEKRWCSDIDKIKAKLNEKGIVFEEKWRRDFTDEEIEAMRVKSEDTDKIKKEFRRRMIQEQRKRQR